ncbi:MAG TPA: hypothetical protein VGG23_00150 [Acidimicrobiales bacterium]|jgi:hypothetical protein
MTSSPWPYHSYADRRWLGGESGSDRALAAVVRTLRTTVAEAGRAVDDTPESLLGGLGQLAAVSERIDWAMLSLVGEARANGVSWSAIGGALGVSKQAAQQRFAPYVKQALDRAASTSDR